MTRARVELVSEAALAAGGEVLRTGGLVVTPSLTNYGLMCNPFDEAAIQRVFDAKRRTKFGPLTLFIAEPAEAPTYARLPDRIDPSVLDQLWPSPVAIILELTYPFPRALTLGTPTIAVCCQGPSPLQGLLRHAGMPLGGTSANLSGQGDIDVSFEKALDDLGDAVDLIIDEGPESRAARTPQAHPGNSIIDLTFDRPYLVRHGGVPPERIREAIPDLVDDRPRYDELLAARIDEVRAGA